ncbi:hypothetical protein CLV70_107362 [Pseudosporangium ferrugineum]|uniref:Uncharacterized protein n=1 Tax=Pseudosporangium ferrugineum TaxID=439699 RepID=A0A2T0S6X2_9ACTN|nr:hypothetical protein CLV70_107362 [Pseudosporangium ferrugineum]
MQIPHPAPPIDHLTEQQRPPITEPRHEPPELMPGIGLSNGHSPLGNPRPDQQPDPVVTAQPPGLEPELPRKTLIKNQKIRPGRGLGLPHHGHLGKLIGKAVLDLDPLPDAPRPPPRRPHPSR